MEEHTFTDILLICKGWYNKSKYPDILAALDAYYHKHYGCVDIIMDKGFANHLFLQPLVVEAVKRDPKLVRYIFEPSYSMVSNKETFSEVMYDRLLGLIGMIEHGTFDLRDYEHMLSRNTQEAEIESVGII